MHSSVIFSLISPSALFDCSTFIKWLIVAAVTSWSQLGFVRVDDAWVFNGDPFMRKCYHLDVCWRHSASLLSYAMSNMLESLISIDWNDQWIQLTSTLVYSNDLVIVELEWKMCLFYLGSFWQRFALVSVKTLSRVSYSFYSKFCMLLRSHYNVQLTSTVFTVRQISWATVKLYYCCCHGGESYPIRMGLGSILAFPQCWRIGRGQSV